MSVGILNPWAVIVAAFFHIVLGMAWYHQKVFGKAWAMHVGFKKLPKMHKSSIFISMFAALLIAIILSFVATIFERSVIGGFITGFLSWAGFVATTSINPVLWERRDPHLFFINNAYYLLSMIVMGIIVGVWV